MLLWLSVYAIPLLVLCIVLGEYVKTALHSTQRPSGRVVPALPPTVHGGCAPVVKLSTLPVRGHVCRGHSGSSFNFQC